MKKEYMEPTFEVVELKMEAQLLAGSDPSTTTATLSSDEIDGYVD